MKILALLSLFFGALHAAPSEPVQNVVILGGGPAGLSAAIFAGQANLSPLVLSCSDCNDGLKAIQRIENFPGFPEGIQGEELGKLIRLQAEKFGARFMTGSVVAADLSSYPFKLTLDNGRELYTQALIVAIGSQKRWLGIDSEEALKGRGVFGKSTEAPHSHAAAVLGGGDAAMEEALHLSTQADRVILIHRGPRLSGSAYLQERISSNPKIEILFDTLVEKILDPEEGLVRGLVLRNEKTNETQFLECDGVFVSIGSRPNTDLFKGQLDLTATGHIKIDSPSARTSLPGVFAAGDVEEPSYRKAAVAIGSGCVAALDANAFLNAHQLVRLYVGELQERWSFPSDHLPIGVSISDGKSGFSFISWNVLNTAYLHWIVNNGQGLARSAITEEDVKIKENGLTLREQHTIDLILEMIHASKQVFCLQECSECFIQELASQLPKNIQIVRSSETAVRNQNLILYDQKMFRLLEKHLHKSPFPSDPGRPLQEVLLEKNGIVYQFFNAHLKCDSGKTQRFELARFIQERQREGAIAILAGDLNVSQLHMEEALGDKTFTPYTPYKTTVSPELYSKAIDHIFIQGNLMQARPLAPNEVLKDLQKIVDLLSIPAKQ